MAFENTVDTTQTEEITDLASYIATSSNTLRVPTDKTITQNIVVPESCSIQFLNGAKFSHSSYTIEFTGKLIGDPMWQIFSGSGAITFNEGSVPHVRPEWWGIDYAGDNTTSAQRAINSVSSGGIVLFSAPEYPIIGPLTNNSGAIIINHSSTDILGLLDATYDNSIQTGVTTFELSHGWSFVATADSLYIYKNGSFAGQIA